MELAGGGDGDAQFFKFGAGEAVFITAGEALDNFAEFTDAGSFLAEFEEGHAFAQACGAKLETLGIVGEDFVVGGDGIDVLLLLVKDFAEVELGVGGEISVGVKLQVVLKFGAGEIVFAGGDVAKAVGIESVGGGCAGGRSRGDGLCCAGGRSRCGQASGRSGRSGAGDFGIETLDSVLKVDELLIELAEARLDFLEVVRETLNLRGHGVEARAGIGLDVLDGFLEGAHGGGELIDVVAGLPDERLHDGVVLSDLSGKILLALKQGSDVALKLDEFASDGFGWTRADETSGKGAGKNGGAKNGDVANTHGTILLKDAERLHTDNGWRAADKSHTGRGNRSHFNKIAARWQGFAQPRGCFGHQTVIVANSVKRLSLLSRNGRGGSAASKPRCSRCRRASLCRSWWC